MNFKTFKISLSTLFFMLALDCVIFVISFIKTISNISNNDMLLMIIANGLIQIFISIYFYFIEYYIEKILFINDVPLKMVKQEELCNFIYSNRMYKVSIIVLIEFIICILYNICIFTSYYQQQSGILVCVIYFLLSCNIAKTTLKEIKISTKKIKKCKKAVEEHPLLYSQISKEDILI